MRIVVCADSSREIGFGHITRSLTLANALTDLGADVICLGQGMTKGKNTAPSFYKMDSRELVLAGGRDTAFEVLRLLPDAVVTDGYHFDRDFYGSLEDAHVPYGVIDDNGETRAINPCVVHNQNPSASRNLYSNVSEKAVFLLGLNYALLRPEVRAIAERVSPKGNYVLISFGGTDLLNLTVPVAEALVRAGHRIAVSEGFQGEIEHSQNMAGTAGQVSFFTSPRFLEALASAEIAVLGAGTSLWEASALKTRALGVVVADNQVAPATKAKSLGYLLDLLLIENRERTGETPQAITEILKRTGKGIQQIPEKGVPLDGAARVASVFLAEFSS